MSGGAGWAAAHLTESEGALAAGEWFAAARASQYPLFGTRDLAGAGRARRRARPGSAPNG